MRSLAHEWIEVSGEVVRSGAAPGLRYSELVHSVGSSQPPHAHRLSFFALTMDGTYWEEAGDRVHECGPGSVLFLPAGAEHAITVVLKMARCFLVEVDGSGIASRFELKVSPSILHAQGGPMAAALRDMYDEVRLRDSSSPLALHGLLLQLLAGASRSAIDIESGPGGPLSRINDLLRERFRERLTIEEIAGSVGLSSGQVSRIFRGAHRRTIAEEQRRLRIEYARRRMMEPAVPLAKIAEESGFADQAHFCRAFKRVTGTTPARYRRRIQSEGDPTT